MVFADWRDGSGGGAEGGNMRRRYEDVVRCFRPNHRRK